MKDRKLKDYFRVSQEEIFMTTIEFLEKNDNLQYMLNGFKFSNKKL